MKETDGYKIKDAELFEVSVVSVPCNQGATFSVAKSFDSMEEYNQFKREFVKANSTAAADAVKIEQPSEEKSSLMETDMSEENYLLKLESFDLESFAKDVAEKTATSNCYETSRAKKQHKKSRKLKPLKKQQK